MAWRPKIRGRRSSTPPPATPVVKEIGSKLTAKDAAYIKGQLGAGASQSWLAMRYAVSSVTILNIGAGKKWAGVIAAAGELEGPPKGTHVKKWLEAHGRVT